MPRPRGSSPAAAAPTIWGVPEGEGTTRLRIFVKRSRQIRQKRIKTYVLDGVAEVLEVVEGTREEEEDGALYPGKQVSSSLSFTVIW